MTLSGGAYPINRASCGLLKKFAMITVMIGGKMDRMPGTTNTDTCTGANFTLLESDATDRCCVPYDDRESEVDTESDARSMAPLKSC